MEKRKYTLEEVTISPDIPKSARLRLLSDLYPPKCAGPGVALLSDFNAYIHVFKNMTGIGLGDPIESSKKLLTEDDVQELNRRISDMKRSLRSLSACIIKEEEQR